MDLLEEKSTTLIDPGLNIAIDEALILWKGKLLFKQFIRTKRSRFGIKVFFTCPGDTKWQGYCYKFKIYYGKEAEYNVPEAGAELSKSEVIVIDMMSGLLDCGRHVVTDNWYSSLRLARALLAKKTDLTGVVRANRGVPEMLRNENLAKKNSSFPRNGNILVCKYEDRKTVHNITTR